jgi:glutathione S-transferase
MSLILYQYAGGDGVLSLSPPCMKVQLALKRLDLPHKVVNVRTPAQVKRASKTGRLPALELPDGRKVVDSVAILDVLEEQAGRSLSPDAPAARARDRAWEHFANDTLYWRGLYMRWMPEGNRKRLIRVLLGSASWLKARLVGFALTRRIHARCRGQGIGLRPQAEVEADFERLLDLVTDGLAGGPFLDGRDAPGRGDLAIASFLVQVGWKEIDPIQLSRFKQRHELLSYVRRTLEACEVGPPDWLEAAAG